MPSKGGFEFGPCRLDAQSRRLMRGDQLVPLTPRQFDLLHVLVSRAGRVISKDVLIREAWQDVSVTDNNLVQVIRQLRQLLDAGDVDRYIKTESRDGYRFVEPVTHVAARHTDADLDALLAPHRAWIDGRAALETLERTQIAGARVIFEQLLVDHSGDARVQVGLANACALQFEATRAELVPDTDALGKAVVHAREACRLNPESGETWVTLGFVLERTGDRLTAQAALRHGVSLDPHNWRHQFRLALGTWGNERLAAVRDTLALMPDAPLARLLAATVYVAREALREAERELDAGLAFMPSEPSAPARFSPVALYYLKGLLCLARGADDEALGWFGRELALEARGHLYGSECCANTWHAVGACHLRRGDQPAARAAFEEAIARVPRHPMAHAGLALLEKRGLHNDEGGNPILLRSGSPATPISVDIALVRAAALVANGDAPGAAQLVAAALASAPPGNAAWLVPIEPLLGVQRARAAWTMVLAALKTRAA